MDASVDYLLIGGSLVVSNHLDEVVMQVKKECNIPVVLFRVPPPSCPDMRTHSYTFPLFQAVTRNC